MRRLLSPLATWLLVGCLDPTQATIEVTTNVGCGDESPSPDTLFETGLVAGSPATVSEGDLQATTRACTAGSDGTARVGSIVVYPRDGAEQAGVLVIGTVGDVSVESCLERVRAASTDLAGCIVARRNIAFVSHQSLRVPVLLDGRCEGVVCDEGQTCVFGGGKPSCVAADVECTGTDCDVPTSTGAGGAGGGGTGGSPPAQPVFTPLSPPSGLVSTQAMGVSDDGLVVVGLGQGADNVVHPLVWRGPKLHQLDAARGTVFDACGGGDLVVGDLGTGTTHATAWQWNAGQQAYASVWSLATASGTSALDCDATGTLILTTGGAGGFEIHTLGAQPALDGELASAFELSSSGTVVVGSVPGTGAAAYWPLSQAGVLSPPIALSPANGIGYAVNAEGTLVAASIQDDLVVFEVGNAVPVLQLPADFVPDAIAGDASAYIVVGSCDPFVQPRACVVVDGQGPFDVDPVTGTPWSTTASTDFGGLQLVIAQDVSADGKVIVGSAIDPASSRRIAWRLTLP